MRIEYGEGKSKYGPGILIKLSGDEIATAIDSYLVAHGIYVDGARTISVNGELCDTGQVYVDPSGSIFLEGNKISGRGPEYQEEA